MTRLRTFWKMVVNGDPVLFTYICRHEKQFVVRNGFSKDYLFIFNIRERITMLWFTLHITHFRRFPGKWYFEKVLCLYSFAFWHDHCWFYLHTSNGFFFLIEKCRSLGFKVIFLDDGLGGENGLEKALYASTFIAEDLESFGFFDRSRKVQLVFTVACRRFLVGVRMGY